MHEIHHDSAFYSNPSRFDAFRFSRPKQTNETKEEQEEQVADIKGAIVNAINPDCRPDAVTGSDRTVTEAAKSGRGGGGGGGGVGHAQISDPRSKQQSAVTTGDDAFLTFGHGKHSCPGRFFAAQEMKLMLAHLVQHYDVEYMAERPTPQAIMETKLPSRSTIIRVRRKPKA